MAPLLILLAVVLLYGALTAGAVVAALCWRSGRWPLAAVLAACPLVLALVVGPISSGRLQAALAWSVLLLLCSGLAYVVWIRPTATWKTRKEAREAGRKAVLHLALLTGSAIFLVPFAWLVVTSLKEDEDMSQFPPVWVPRQQVKTTIDGKQVGLATTTYQGVPVTVAVMQEKDTGANVLRITSPRALAGREFEAPRSAVKKIKKFGPVWKNYPDALAFLPPETRSGLVFLTNTLILCVLTIVGTILSSSLVAFGFARLRWPGRDALFVVLLATMMLPGAVTMMPVFLIFRAIGWIDTLQPLWVPAFFGSAFNVFLLRQFFLTIPNDLEDAAKIDGCSYLGIYWRIMLPLIKPALAALTIMTFMGSWNNFMGPLIYLSSPTRMPLAYALQLFQTAHGGEPGLLMAASTMMMLPVLVLFFLTQRYFIQGVTLTGIKG